MHTYIRRPLVGHQAVKDSFQVYKNHCFNRSFANFKVHSTSNFKVYSINISFQVFMQPVSMLL